MFQYIILKWKNFAFYLMMNVKILNGICKCYLMICQASHSLYGMRRMEHIITTNHTNNTKKSNSKNCLCLKWGVQILTVNG